MVETFDLGDTVIMKKPHACGINSWTVIRTGADIKLRCNGCSRVVMLDRLDFLKRAKRIVAKEEPAE